MYICIYIYVYNRQSKFSILHLNDTEMLLETLYEDWTNSVYIKRHTKAFESMTAYRLNFSLKHFNAFRLY